MNDQVRELIRYVCRGNIPRAQEQVRVILSKDIAEKDRKFRETMITQLDILEAKQNELPANLKSLLYAEPCSGYCPDRFMLRDGEKAIVEKTLSAYRAAERLKELGVSYFPAVLLYGDSGCGKTELARYIAYKAELPFLFVRFANLIDSYMGNTQKHLADIFDYARTKPCVLCFDELDTIGLARGQTQDVGEMNRITIALMQELDRLPNNVILIGTTNRFDALDAALVRRFKICSEVKPLSRRQAWELAEMYFKRVGIAPEKIKTWLADQLFDELVSADKVIKTCTEYVIEQVLKEGTENG